MQTNENAGYSNLKTGATGVPKGRLAAFAPLALAMGLFALPAPAAEVAPTAAPAASQAGQLPAGSRLLPVNGRQLHVRSLGPVKASAAAPHVVLLSGPTDHWHSDSAWFALLQPLLAERFTTHAIDRAGHGFSDIAGTLSYAQFADDLATLLPALSDKPVVVVAFASSNLALQRLLARPEQRSRIKAALLLDPDALAPELISFYADQAGRYKKMDPAKIGPWLAAGNYDERAKGNSARDRDSVSKLMPPELAGKMDWAAFDAVSAKWREHDRILARWQEIANYDTDVTGAASLGWPAEVPVWTVDSDFEAAAVEAEPDNAQLKQWRELSSMWMAALPGGCHEVRPHREHLLTFVDAALIVTRVGQLAAGEPCPLQR